MSHQPGTRRSYRWAYPMRALLAGILLAGLSGCVHVAHEPAIPFPERPAVSFFRAPVGICLSEEDADQVLRFLLKLNEFEAARERLLKD